MGAQGIRLPDQAFWDRYFTLLQAAGIKPDQARWYVLRVEQYLKAHPDLALADHGPEHLDVCNGSADPRARLKRPAGVGLTEWLSEDVVEIADEVEHAAAQILERSEAGALEQPSSEDREPDLDLLEPRAVSRGVNKADLVRGILQERAACVLGLEDPGLALDAERLFEAAVSGHQLDEGCRAGRIELVGDEDPTGIGVGRDSRLNMRGEICLGSRRPEGRADNFAGSDIEVGKQTPGTVSVILKLDTFD